MVVLSEIAEFISKTSYLISDVILFILELSSLIGQILVNQFVFVLEFTKKFFLLINSLVLIVCEDSYFFFQDIKESALHFSGFVANGLSCLGNAFIQTASAVSYQTTNFSNFIFGIVNGISQIFSSTILFLKFFINLIGEGFLLIGSSIWLAVTNIPAAITYFSIELIKLIHYVLKGTKTICLLLNCAVINTIYGILKFICNLPYDSFFGLLLGAMILYIIFRKWSKIYLMVFYISRSVYYYAVLFAQILWTRIFSKKRRHNTGGSNICYNSQDEQFEDKLCVVCKDNFKEILIFPCKHVCLCAMCCAHIKSNQRVCPICRTYIKSKMKVYL